MYRLLLITIMFSNFAYSAEQHQKLEEVLLTPKAKLDAKIAKFKEQRRSKKTYTPRGKLAKKYK